MNSKLTQVRLHLVAQSPKSIHRKLNVHPILCLPDVLQRGSVNMYLLQNYEIECPDTKTKFSLKTGDITDW